MENKSFRIRTTAGGEDKYLTVKLDQKYDYLEVLSLKINQENFYRDFSADYGVLVGRVIANDGLGIPNANISVFVPLSDDDSNNSVISGIYPYKEIHDKNSLGISYNLLTPREKMKVGTFPSKQQFLDNDTYIEVYEKYYKFTTKTNGSGDYMIFGVPIGTNSVHMDLDLSDIGDLSFSANDLIASGISEKLFVKSDNDVFDFLESNDLETLPQIMMQNVSVDIRPLWGNKDENEIGITRYDFKVAITANPVATFILNFGIDKFTRDESGVDMINYNGRGDGITGSDGSSKYAPGHMDNIHPYIDDGSGTNYGEPEIKIFKWDKAYTKSEEVDYVKVVKTSSTTSQGCVIVYLPCDQDKFVTNEFGETVPSLDDTKGIGTSGRYDMKVILDGGNTPNYGAYWSYVIQNQSQQGGSKPSMRFERNRIYSAAMRFTAFSTNKGRSPNPFAIRASRDGNVANYPNNFDFRDNDWINGFLYFGRVGNQDSTTTQRKTPDDLMFTIDGRRYYKVETRFIDMTDYYDILSDQVNTFWCEVDTNDTRFTNITVTKQDKNLEYDQIPERAPSRGNRMIFFLGLRNGVNNFKSFKNNIKR